MVYVTEEESVPTVLRKVPTIGAICSIADPDGRKLPQWFQDFSGPKIRLDFDDIEADRWQARVGCTQEQVAALVAWCRGLPEGDVLFHCAAGISRSPAAALIYFWVRGMDWSEGEAHLAAAIVHAYKLGLREIDTCFPQRRMLNYAEQILRGGENGS